ncbi:FecR domain-containing protein [Pseudomonas qingdaonensis]|nr:FecR domain-containing protein [Pseudomonas qingdaonensis]
MSQQACAWFALIFEGSASQAEHEQWLEWMLADPRHAKAYLELEALWALAAELPAVQAPPAPRPAASRGGASCNWPWRRAPPQWPPARPRCGSRATACRLPTCTRVGETRTERLPDGSVIELAGNTALDLDFSGTTRRLRMLRGQAYFKVAADTRPLRIDTEAGTVVSHHGAFCLSCDAGSADLAVSEHNAGVQIPASRHNWARARP